VAGDTNTHQSHNQSIHPPTPIPTYNQPFQKIFYSLEFVDIKSRRRYGWISYEESVGEEDRDSGGH
jgi:hypothetical protein